MRARLARGAAAAGLAISLVAGPLAARPFTRADLSPAFLRFERAFAAAPVDGPLLGSLDRRFDAFTMRAFMGDFSAAYVALNEMAADLELGRPRTPLERVVDALAVDLEPAFLGPSPRVAPTLVLRSVVPIELEEQLVVEGYVELRLEDGRIVRGPDVRFSLDDLDEVDVPAPFPDAFRDAPRGDHDVRFVAAGRASLPRRLSVGDASLDATRGELLTRLAALPADRAAPDAVEVCRARAGLLRSDPFGLETAILVEPPVALADAVAREVAALERGEDPYHARSDDHWRTFRIGQRQAPARVFAPATADPATRPLLVALHGAGADENMFFRAYGDGLLRRLARERGVVVVTPRTETLLRSDGALADLLEGVRRDHAFDERRVYLLGHSMGAMAAMRRAATDADRLAAVACIAGAAPLDPEAPAAPTLVVTGSADPIVPRTRVAPVARAAAEAGLPVELRVREGAGHTLLVPLVLPEALDWLLGYSR